MMDVISWRPGAVLQICWPGVLPGACTTAEVVYGLNCKLVIYWIQFHIPTSRAPWLRENRHFAMPESGSRLTRHFSRLDSRPILATWVLRCGGVAPLRLIGFIS